MSVHTPTRPARAADALARRSAGLLSWALIWLLAGPAAARDPASLGDLQIPASRVPDWYALDYLPLDTSSWAVRDVPCGGQATLTSAVAAAGPNTILQLAGSCTYVIDGFTFEIGKSRLVLRGAGPSTVLEFTHNDQTGIVLGLRGWPLNEVFGDPRPWTAGYRLGDDVLTLASISGLQVGAWVRLRANNEPDWHSNSRNGYSAKLACVGASGGAACAGLASNQVRLDRPLDSEFGQGGQVLERVTGRFVEYSGIERLSIRHRTPSQIESYRSRLVIEDCHECWVVDTHFGDAGNSHIVIGDSSRVLIRGNDFGSNQCTDSGQTCLWNKGAIYFNQHAYDNVFENNTVRNSPSGPLLQGGGGNVVAYNYLSADASVQCERHVFLHGQGVRASLIEGNDVTCMMEWDSFRDGQGYYNTFYRNRLRESPSSPSFGGYYRGRLGGEAQGSYIHRDITVIGNHVNELRGGPFPTGLGLDHTPDARHTHLDTWVAYNVSRSGVEFDPRATTTVKHDNPVRSSPDPAWSGLSFPASLYRSQAPSWWCQESGAFPNIGAFTDTAGVYAMLPAQRRLQGLSCTPVPTGGGGGLQPPAAPILLPD